MRRSSILMLLIWGGIWLRIWIFLLNACCLTKTRLESQRFLTETDVISSSTIPDEILDRSRMSLISASKCSPLDSTIAIAFNCLSFSEPKISSLRDSDIPKIEFSGVRSSWLMLARNSSLSLVARRSCSLDCWS